ncbi:MAG TPA: hypothetical protein VG713_12715, partial [Pirellulales bacterium]|nr:hypothetical protein [Pirellulales bacterium]
ANPIVDLLLVDHLYVHLQKAERTCPAIPIRGWHSAVPGQKDQPRIRTGRSSTCARLRSAEKPAHTAAGFAPAALVKKLRFQDED